MMPAHNHYARLFLKCFLSLSLAVVGILSFAFVGVVCLASEENAAFEMLPWAVGQFAVYQIISMEGEDAENRYEISITGEENIDGTIYYWLQSDIYENIVMYGYNKIQNDLKKNISFKALVSPKNTYAFLNDPGRFIAAGVFPDNAIKCAVQVGNGAWRWIDPKEFFNHQDVIEGTPYALTPHARGSIDFSRLVMDTNRQRIHTPAGQIDCHHFYVSTSVSDEYWKEGMDLWRSPKIPILGLVKMEFSKTHYWDKWEYAHTSSQGRGIVGFFSFLYQKRVPGRRMPDTCTMLLIDYGQR